MINNNDEISALLRLEAACRVMKFIDDSEDGGTDDEFNMVAKEADKALDELEEIRGCKFDAKASYEEMVRMNAKKKAE